MRRTQRRRAGRLGRRRARGRAAAADVPPSPNRGDRSAPPPLARRYTHTPTGIASSSSRSGGQMKPWSVLRPPSGVRPSGRARRPGPHRSPGRRRPRRPAGRRRSARPRARAAASANRRRNPGSCVSTYSCSPVSASSMSIGPTSGSSVSRRSYSRIAIDLVPPGQRLQRLLPARLADEVRDDEHERAALDPALAGLEERREVGHRRRRGADAPAGR